MWNDIRTRYEGFIEGYLVKDDTPEEFLDKLYRASKMYGEKFKFKCKITDSTFIEFESKNDCLKIISGLLNQDLNTIRIQIVDKLIWVKYSNEYNFEIVS